MLCGEQLRRGNARRGKARLGARRLRQGSAQFCDGYARPSAAQLRHGVEQHSYGTALTRSALERQGVVWRRRCGVAKRSRGEMRGGAWEMLSREGGQAPARNGLESLRKSAATWSSGTGKEWPRPALAKMCPCQALRRKVLAWWGCGGHGEAS